MIQVDGRTRQTLVKGPYVHALFAQGAIADPGIDLESAIDGNLNVNEIALGTLSNISSE